MTFEMHYFFKISLSFKYKLGKWERKISIISISNINLTRKREKNINLACEEKNINLACEKKYLFVRSKEK